MIPCHECRAQGSSFFSAPQPLGGPQTDLRPNADLATNSTGTVNICTQCNMPEGWDQILISEWMVCKSVKMSNTVYLAVAEQRKKRKVEKKINKHKVMKSEIFTQWWAFRYKTTLFLVKPVRKYASVCCNTAASPSTEGLQAFTVKINSLHCVFMTRTNMFCF